MEVSIPMLPAVFVGTGDLFTALMLAWLHKGESLPSACQKTLSCMQTVLTRTLEHARREFVNCAVSSCCCEVKESGLAWRNLDRIGTTSAFH